MIVFSLISQSSSQLVNIHLPMTDEHGQTITFIHSAAGEGAYLTIARHL
jgi:hypothetical protein